MQFSTILIAAVASALTVSAAPAESSKRTCTTVWPTARGNFVLEKKGATIPTQDIDFKIPEGAVGPCTLVLSFPKGKGLDNYGDVRSNVYERLADQGFKVGSLVGTVDLKGSAGAAETVRAGDGGDEDGGELHFDGWLGGCYKTL